MGRSPRQRGVVAALGAALIAASLGSIPARAAETTPTEPTVAETSPPEPTPSPTPIPQVSPSPSPSASPTLTPSPTIEPSTQPTQSPSSSESPSPSQTPSTSPTTTPTDEGNVDDYIVVVRNGAYIDSVKSKAEEIGGRSDKELRGAVDGFTAELSAQDAQELAADPNVEFVEIDQPLSINAAIDTSAQCNAGTLGAVDDGSAGPLSLGFTVNWFGTEYSSIYINNNGGIVFDDGQGSFTSYRNVDIDTATRPYILPLFTDIDTRYSTGRVTYGPIDSSNASAGYCINWVQVGEYGSSTNDYSFQLKLVNQTNGDVDIEFNYDVVKSNPTNAYNNRFEVGYVDPNNRANSMELANAGEATSTVATRLLTECFPAASPCSPGGRFTYEVRPGTVPTPAPSISPTDGPTATPSPQPTQSNPPWGLDRIDDSSSPWTRDFTYIPPAEGSSVVAYVVDTGVRYTHVDFGGRASSTGIDEVDNDSNPTDCNGHGTHVAGTVAGTTYGVAKSATVVGVRVLDCSGSGYTSDVVAGLNAISSFHAANHSGKRAVVNMSLGGGKSASIDTAVRSLVNAGIPVVVAAGNSYDDADYYSPAGEPLAITVGSSTSADAISYFSNYGSVVDLFAPGSSILSAYYTSNTASATLSGTSMASPHVAGAVALYLDLNPSATSSQVATAITGNALASAVSSVPTGTTTRLLHTSSFTGDGGSEEPDSGSGDTPPSSGSSGGSSGGGGSSDDSGSGGGGGLNEISTIVPGNSGTPGTQIALAGWGLSTTKGVFFNDTAADFTVVSDSQVDVIVPNVPPGNYVVHAVLAPSVGRASFWTGYRVLASDQAAPPSSPVGSTPVGGTTPDAPAEERSTAADYVTFSKTSTKLTKATRSKLAQLADEFPSSEATATIVTFTNAKESRASVRRALSRANKMEKYLERSGWQGSIEVTTAPASTTAQTRGALVYVAKADGASDKEPNLVSSLIVRVKKNRSISDGDAVRGADKVSGPLADSLEVGPYLGLRMYRVDFAEPVSPAVAERVARQLMKDKGIAFAEPDSLVQSQVTTTNT